MRVTYDASMVASGSFLVFTCMTGYINMGGSLNMTCGMDGTWGSFPNCTMGTMITTTASSMGGKSCLYSTAMLSIQNGTASDWSGLMLLNRTHALSGSFIDYVCMASFNMVGSSRMMCTNGAWSAPPVCMGRIPC